MKRRKKEERLNDIFVVNESGEEYVNYKNNETKLAVRSMLEEDVEYVSYLQGRNRKEKKQLLRKLQEEESEVVYFVLEEIERYNKRQRQNEILAAAELHLDESMDVIVYMELKPEDKGFDIAKQLVLSRVAETINTFYEKTNADGIIRIHRAAWEPQICSGAMPELF